MANNKRQEPKKEWTEQEKWVWKKLCLGEVADFNNPGDPEKEKLYGKYLDSKDDKLWTPENKNTKSRILSSEFLETILLEEPYNSALTRKGVKIIGAWFPDAIDFSFVVIEHQLWLHKSRFDAYVDFSDLKSNNLISFQGSQFNGVLNLHRLHIVGSLFMRGGTRFGEVNLGSAKIGGTLEMDGSKFSGELNMDSLEVNSRLFMRGGAEFGDVNLKSAKIGGTLEMDGSKFKGTLDMESLKVCEKLFMRETQFNSINLMSAMIGKTLEMDGSKFNGKLNMDKIQLDSSLFMRRGAEFGEVTLRSGKIGDTLEMDGSIFKGTLDMESLKVCGKLSMREAQFNYVNFIGASVEKTLEMDGSKFNGKLNMDKIQLDSSLFMRRGAEFNDVIFRGSKIEGTLEMDGSKFTGKLQMDSLQVNSNFFMRGGAEFGDVSIIGSKIGGQFDMSKSKFTGTLIIDKLQVHSSFFMSRGAEFGKVTLISVKIGGQLDISDSIFKSNLNAAEVHVNGSTVIRNSIFDKPIKFYFLKIGGHLHITETPKEKKLPSIDLTGTEINGELHLGSNDYQSPEWKEDAKLSLRNTRVGTVQDLENSWPDKLELRGFTYSNLGGYAGGEGKSMAEREASQLIKWLEKQKEYSPQPYEQLAKVLRETGHKEKANSILYASKQKEREKAKGWRKLGMWILEATIGYGFYLWLTIIYAIAFTFFGALVLWVFGQETANDIPDAFTYSFDMLLPVIRLDEANYSPSIKLYGIAKYYYVYIHKLVGWALATIFIAGLSGITKK